MKNSKKQFNDPEFAFISLGRCGTSLFKHIIDANRQTRLTDECHWFHGLQISGLKYHQFIEKNDLSINTISFESKWWNGIRALNSELFSNYKNLVWGIQLIGHGNLVNLSTLYNVYPGIKTIIMLRDPRDLLHSFFRTGIGFPTFTDDLIKIFDSVSLQSKNHLIITYESLCEEPNSTLQKVCNFLSIKFDEKMITPLTQKVSHARYSALNENKEKTGFSTKKWQRELNSEQLSIINEKAELLSQLNYPIFNDTVTLKCREKITEQQLGVDSGIKKYTLNNFDNNKNLYVYTIKLSSYGIVKIFYDRKNEATLIHDSREIKPIYNEIFSYMLFDLRTYKNIKRVEYETHKNGKQIIELSHISDLLQSYNFWLYSCSLLTKKLVNRYRLYNNFHCKGIIDNAPKSESFNINTGIELTVENIHLYKLSKEDIVLVTNPAHWKDANHLLQKKGLHKNKIFLVV